MALVDSETFKGYLVESPKWPKVGGSSPPEVETFSVSKTSTLSQDHPFVSRKWMLLPAHSNISNINFTTKIYFGKEYRYGNYIATNTLMTNMTKLETEKRLAAWRSGWCWDLWILGNRGFFGVQHLFCFCCCCCFCFVLFCFCGSTLNCGNHADSYLRSHGC